MRASQAIQYLSEHQNPDEEIILLYWAKDLFDEEFPNLSQDIWDEAVEVIEEDGYLGNVGSDIYDAIFDKLTERNNL